LHTDPKHIEQCRSRDNLLAFAIGSAVVDQILEHSSANHDTVQNWEHVEAK
jgi:hypothetical protein